MPLTSGGGLPCTTLLPPTWTGGTDLYSATFSFHVGFPKKKMLVCKSSLPSKAFAWNCLQNLSICIEAQGSLLKPQQNIQTFKTASNTKKCKQSHNSRQWVFGIATSSIIVGTKWSLNEDCYSIATLFKSPWQPWDIFKSPVDNAETLLWRQTGAAFLITTHSRVDKTKQSGLLLISQF